MTAALEPLYTACSCGMLTMLPLIDAVAMKLPATKLSRGLPSSVVPSFFCRRKCAPALLAHHMTPSTLTAMTFLAVSTAVDESAVHPRDTRVGHKDVQPAVELGHDLVDGPVDSVGRDHVHLVCLACANECQYATSKMWAESTYT